jgi:hypothetical protein
LSNARTRATGWGKIRWQPQVYYNFKNTPLLWVSASHFSYQFTREQGMWLRRKLHARLTRFSSYSRSLQPRMFSRIFSSWPGTHTSCECGESKGESQSMTRTGVT